MHLWIASIFAVHLAVGTPIGPDSSAFVVSKPDTLAPVSVVADTMPAVTSVAMDSVNAPRQATPTEATLAAVIVPTLDMSTRLLPSRSSVIPSFDTGPDSATGDTTKATRRPRAIEYSDAYHTRLKIHQIGAYLMIPLFIGEYVLGEKLLTSTNRSDGLKTAHSVVAAGVGVVFVANTVTGAWNFWDSRKDPNGRTRRDVHSALMLASDVGFLLTAASAGNAQRSLSQARTHRTIAISSIALSAIGSGMMWLWKN
jgi:hypothetical protein